MLEMENYTQATHSISVDTFLLFFHQTQIYVVNPFEVSRFFSRSILASIAWCQQSGWEAGVQRVGAGPGPGAAAAGVLDRHRLPGRHRHHLHSAVLQPGVVTNQEE